MTHYILVGCWHGDHKVMDLNPVVLTGLSKS